MGKAKRLEKQGWHRVNIKYKAGRRSGDFVKWCSEQCPNNWRAVYFKDGSATFVFEQEGDATMFALVWA